MNAKLLIRISAFLVFIHLIGHTLRYFSWDEVEGLGGVVKEMRSHSARFMGVERSLADYYSGYSWTLFGLYGMSVVLLWQLSGFLKGNRNLIKQLLLPIGIAYLFFGTIELLYFPPFAAIISLLVGFLILLSTRIL